MCKIKEINFVLQNIEDESEAPQLELSFEYLLAKNKLRWINISSPQAIFMATCLQSIVDELLVKKNGPNNHKTDLKTNWTYMKRDGTVSPVSLNRCISDSLPTTPRSSQQWNEPFSIKKLPEKFSSNRSLNLTTTNNELIANDAFNGIGDEED